jgi:Na+-driven multidrug efflux pump
MIGAEMFAPQILKAVATNAEMFEPALLYMRIRCLAQPAVLFCSVAQSGLLGMQDSMSALYSIVLMCLINVVGDWLMVGCWGMGIGGSAWATVASAYGAAVALAWAWSRRPDCENPFKDVRFPDMQELKEFCSGFGVLWGISTLDTLCYGCVRVGATALGTLPCAAYTALYSLWMPLSFMSMPLRQSAMVFLPQFMTTSKLKGKCSTLNSEVRRKKGLYCTRGGLEGV